MLVIQGSREYVEAGNIVPVLNILNTLIEPQNIKKFANKMMFVIDGYNEDPRELAEIPEVRNWIKKLDESFPYWFFFCSPHCQTLKFLAFTLSEIQKDSRGQVFIDGDQLLKFMLEHFEAMNALEDKGLITAVENFKVSKKIEKYFKDNAKPIIFNQ